MTQRYRRREEADEAGRKMERERDGKHVGDTWVVFWGEFQFVGKLHGSCRGVYHVHQH